MRFLIDAQLPPRLAKWLVEMGHEADHVFDVESLAADDRLIWDTAISTGSIIVTKDKDFARYREQAFGPQILYLRLKNGTTAQLIAHLENNWSSISLRLKADQAIIDVG